jgi:uncharacterized protein YkwD
MKALNRFFPLLLILLLLLPGCSAGRTIRPDPFPRIETPRESIAEQAEPVIIAAAVAPQKTDKATKFLPDTALIEEELLALINAARAAEKGEPLEVEESMLWAARLRSEELHAEFSHTRPDGTPYSTVFDEVGFTYSGKWHGENASSLLFPTGEYDEKQIAQIMYEDLAKSPGHSSNMLRSQYAQVGIGVTATAEKGETKVCSSQLFAST